MIYNEKKGVVRFIVCTCMHNTQWIAKAIEDNKYKWDSQDMGQSRDYLGLEEMKEEI